MAWRIRYRRGRPYDLVEEAGGETDVPYGVQVLVADTLSSMHNAFPGKTFRLEDIAFVGSCTKRLMESCLHAMKKAGRVAYYGGRWELKDGS